MRDFFMSIDEAGGRLPFHTFDLNHITWLSCLLFGIVIVTIFYKHTSIHNRKRVRCITAYLLLILELLRKGSLLYLGTFTVEEMPLHLCSFGVYICFYQHFKPSSLTNNTLFTLIMPGALAALLFPDWNVSNHFNYYYIHSWLTHALLALYVIMQLTTKEITPNIKTLPKIILYLGIYALPVYAFNKVYNTNFLFINTPSHGSPLVLLETYLGNPGYIVGLLGLCVAVWLVMYGIHGLLVRRTKRFA